jgi:hypothetical protein
MLITNASVNDDVDAVLETDDQSMHYAPHSNRTTQLDIGHHNVSDLLESLSLEQRAYYSRKYDQRAPEQVATREGVIMTWEKPAAATLRHMRYRSELTRQIFYVASPEGVCDLNGMSVALPELIAGRSLRIVPYFPSYSINNLVERTLPGILAAQRRDFGLPAVIAEMVKDKAQFHYLMHEHFPTLIPRFEVLTGADLIGSGVNNSHDPSPIEIVMLQTAELIREARNYGLHMDGYRNGVVLRKILSDGGFGTLIVRERIESDGTAGYEVIGDQRLQNRNLHQLMEDVLDPQSQYLMTRLLELDASPGISCVVEAGELHPLPLNGQIQDESGAAVGTKTLGLSATDIADITFRGHHEDIIQALALPIFDKVLSLCSDRTAVNGLINLDFMVTTEREQKLFNLVENTPFLHEHFWHLVSSRYQVAEMNPRMTNLTSAANGVLTILGASHHIDNYRRLLAHDGDLGLANYDSRYLKLPVGMTADDAYAHFLERQMLICRHGYDEAGVILRMMPPLVDDQPDWTKGAGITIYGPKAQFSEIERLALG